MIIVLFFSFEDFFAYFRGFSH